MFNFANRSAQLLGSEFRNLWGGFPPEVPTAEGMCDENCQTVKDLMPGGVMSHTYFEYIMSWWPYRDDPNVLFLHYSDVRKDLKGSVEKVCLTEVKSLHKFADQRIGLTQFST